MKHPSENQTQEVLAGLVERVTYHNVENGFCVLRAKARGHRDVVTVVGHAATIAAGEWITASGEWINDQTHCQQFKARSCGHRRRLEPKASRNTNGRYR
jgi:exodeoxyribonuclease V alpha subunit